MKTKPPPITHILAAFKARGSGSVQAWEGQGLLTHRKAARRRLTVSWAQRSNEVCLGRCHSKGGPWTSSNTHLEPVRNAVSGPTQAHPRNQPLRVGPSTLLFNNPWAGDAESPCGLTTFRRKKWPRPAASVLRSRWTVSQLATAGPRGRPALRPNPNFALEKSLHL